jgi:hypothetical protein
MLDIKLKDQLQATLQLLTRPVEIIASLDERPASADMRRLLEEIDGLSELISTRFDGQAQRRPSFQITRAGQEMGLHFAAVPLGHEFSSLVLALLHAGGHPPKVDAERIEQIRALQGDFVFETWMRPELPQLPGCGAGAESAGGAEPARAPCGDRRRSVRRRSAAAPDHGRADGLPERPAFGLGAHGTGADRRPARHRRGAA